jgi:hypothetical protein
VVHTTQSEIARKFNVKRITVIPWMHGANGSMSVLSSIIAGNFSMPFGFTPTFFFGISIYFTLGLILLTKPD